MRSRYVSLLAISASFLLAMWLDFIVWPTHNSAIFFAIPLVLASRVVGWRAVVVVAALAIVGDVYSVSMTMVPLGLAIVRGVCLLLIGLLAFWVAQAREVEEQRYRELDRTREQLREFMGMVAHDLRSPLSVALGYVQLMRRELPEDYVEGGGSRLTMAERALTRMRRLLDDLMDAVRIGGGQFNVRFAPVDLAQLARSTVADESLVHPDHEITVEAPGNMFVDGDEDRLRQVLVNLITNACKYSPSGSAVRVDAVEVGDRIRLSITDQGPGIPPGQIDALFQPFARLTRSAGTAGAGLGLYITRGIVDAHDGRISVTSQVGHGTTFAVELPRQHPPNALSSDHSPGSPVGDDHGRAGG